MAFANSHCTNMAGSNALNAARAGFLADLEGT